MKIIYPLLFIFIAGCSHYSMVPQPQQVNIEVYVDIHSESFINDDAVAIDEYSDEDMPTQPSQHEIDKSVVKSEPAVKYITKEVVKLCAADEIESLLYIPEFNLIGMEDSKGKIIKASLDYIAAVESVIKQIRVSYDECMIQKKKNERSRSNL